MGKGRLDQDNLDLDDRDVLAHGDANGGKVDRSVIVSLQTSIKVSIANRE